LFDIDAFHLTSHNAYKHTCRNPCHWRWMLLRKS